MACCICFEQVSSVGVVQYRICCDTCCEGKLCHECFLKHANRELKHRSEVLCPVCRTPIYKDIIGNFCFEEFDVQLCITNMPFKGVLCILNLLFSITMMTFCFLVWYTSKMIYK